MINTNHAVSRRRPNRAAEVLVRPFPMTGGRAGGFCGTGATRRARQWQRRVLGWPESLTVVSGAAAGATAWTGAALEQAEERAKGLGGLLEMR